MRRSLPRLFSRPLAVAALAAALAVAPLCALAAPDTAGPPTLGHYLDPPSPGEIPENRMSTRKLHFADGAFSYGLRAGLARRTWEIMQDLDAYRPVLDRIFVFDAMLLPGIGNVPMQAPIVDAAVGEGLRIDPETGQTAALVREYYVEREAAKFVARPKTWMQYLERDWSDVPPPPAILFPRDGAERDVWRKAFEDGWKEGVLQAEDTFREDLARLVSDFTGMATFKALRAQGKMSAPMAAETDRGVTTEGRSMRVGDTQLTITVPAQFESRPDRWAPPPLTR